MLIFISNITNAFDIREKHHSKINIIKHKIPKGNGESKILHE